MTMFCLFTYINKYLKSREESLEKIVRHKVKRFSEFFFLTQTPKWLGLEFGFGTCLESIINNRSSPNSRGGKIFHIVQNSQFLTVGQRVSTKNFVYFLSNIMKNI
jgi:hypothetical protein